MTDDIKAIRDALAAVTFYPSGIVSYTPEHWLSCCHPERIARLLDALELAHRQIAAFERDANRTQNAAMRFTP